MHFSTKVYIFFSPHIFLSNNDMNKLRDSANERDCKLKVAKFYSPKKQYYWLGIFTIVRRDM